MFISCSDLHLREDFSASLPEVRRDAYSSWERIYSYAIDERASALVLVGDIFDGPPSSLDVAMFLKGVAKLKEAEVRVYAIQGQHGRAKLPWTSVDPYAWVIDLNLVDEPHMIEEGVYLSGYDTLPPDELQQKLSKRKRSDKTNVMALHQLAKGCIPDIEGHQNWDYDPDWMPKSVRLVLLGDYHDQWSVYTNDGFTLHIYHGSTWMRSITERADKRFLRVELQPDGSFNVLSVRLPTRNFSEISIWTVTQLAQALRTLSNLPNETLVKITYDPDIHDLEQSCRKAVPHGVRVHFYFKPISKEAISVDSYDIEKLRQLSLTGCLDAMVSRDTEAELHSFLYALLEQHDTAEVLEHARIRLFGSGEDENELDANQ
jgi:DNA repair exonuclease SbcCD nuclease subunit